MRSRRREFFQVRATPWAEHDGCAAVADKRAAPWGDRIEKSHDQPPRRRTSHRPRTDHHKVTRVNAQPLNRLPKLALLGLAGLIAAAAPGPTQEELAEQQEWNETIAKLEDMLSGAVEDRHNLLQSFPAGAFGQRQLVGSRLEGLFAGSVFVSHRTYLFPDVTLATDLGIDLARTPAVPPALVRAMTPTDEESARAANFVAGRWLVEELGVQPGDMVAVLAYYGVVGNDATPTLHLVLIRGTPSRDGYRLRRLRFGTMTEAVTHEN